MTTEPENEVRNRLHRNAPALSPHPSLLELHERALFYEALKAPVRRVADGAEARINLLDGPRNEDRADHLWKVLQEVAKIADEIQAEYDQGT